MCGYHYIESQSWIDSFDSASMILSDMGPTGPNTCDAGKIFTGCDALSSGLAVIIITGIILAPVLHRVMHRFHFEVEDK